MIKTENAPTARLMPVSDNHLPPPCTKAIHILGPRSISIIRLPVTYRADKEQLGTAKVASGFEGYGEVFQIPEQKGRLIDNLFEAVGLRATRCFRLVPML